MGERLQWYDDSTDNPPWIDALAKLRLLATREGYCFPHVQAITVAIDQYAEKALATAASFSTSLMESAYPAKPAMCRNRPVDAAAELVDLR